jgi:thioester reductase-like protein
MGYIQSKWVAERIIRLARARGLQVAIYRPGRISGHSQTGATNLDDFFMRLIAGCIQLGLAPDIPMIENLIPVDYTAQAIVHLSQQPALASETLHLLNPQQTQWQWVVDVAQDLGYPLRMVPYQEWRHALVQVALSGSSQVLHSLLLLMQENQADNQVDDWAKQVFDMRKAAAGLAGSDIRFQAIDTALLERMLNDSARRGLFTAPAMQRNAESELASAISG